MFRRRSPTSVPDAASTPSAAADQAVRMAEEIVCDAWAQELLRRQGHTDHDVQVALARYDRACRRLTAAQQAGDPRRIAAGHSAMELARETLHKRSLAAGRAHQFLLEEMDLLDRASAVRARARESEQDAAAANAEPCETTAHTDRRVIAKPRLRQRARRWLDSLAEPWPANRFLQ